MIKEEEKTGESNLPIHGPYWRRLSGPGVAYSPPQNCPIATTCREVALTKSARPKAVKKKSGMNYFLSNFIHKTYKDLTNILEHCTKNGILYVTLKGENVARVLLW